MHQASVGGHVEVMNVLAEAGAKIQCEDDYNLDTPLHLAARFGQSEVLEFLLDRNVNPNPLNKENKTPLDLAKAKNNDLCERYLIESEGLTSHDLKDKNQSLIIRR